LAAAAAVGALASTATVTVTGALVGTAVGTANPLATARLLCSTPVWLSITAGGPRHGGRPLRSRLAVLLRSAYGRSPALVDTVGLLHDTPVWPFSAAAGTLVHAASTTAVVALDTVVRGVGPPVRR
jgi:hypothetical protein